MLKRSLFAIAPIETSCDPQLAIPPGSSSIGAPMGGPSRLEIWITLREGWVFMTMWRLSSYVAILAILAVLLAVPAFAGGAVITNGIDLWKTPAAGGTFVDFSKHP